MIIRRRHTANFTTISNVLFEDERLAADEVGILGYLLSRPHDWEVRRPALMRRWKIGRDAIKRVMTNLIRFGWCRPERKRLPNGTYFMIYEIRDEPGPSLTEEEVRRALSLVSSEAVADDLDGQDGSEAATGDQPMTGDPPTPYPSLADPPLAGPYVAKSNILNTDSTKDESDQKPERERVRAREKHALNLVKFKRRWPTNASDDQVKVDNAWYELSDDEGEAALDGIGPFLENQKRLGKKFPPAGFNYLGQRRWTLLENIPKTAEGPSNYPAGSDEARAIEIIHEIVGRQSAIRTIFRRADGSINAPSGWMMTAQLHRIADAPGQEEWVILSVGGAASWERLFDRLFDRKIHRRRLRQGDRAPWPFAPGPDGRIYPTGPPQTLMSAEDEADFR